MSEFIVVTKEDLVNTIASVLKEQLEVLNLVEQDSQVEYLTRR